MGTFFYSSRIYSSGVLCSNNILNFLSLPQLTFICKETVISVGMKGPSIGRGGTLAWVSVATSTMIFLLDVAKMGPGDALKEGLGDILQDGNIMKVVHDCRPMEDLLYHQFGVTLTNVFDTQVSVILYS